MATMLTEGPCDRVAELRMRLSGGQSGFWELEKHYWRRLAEQMCRCRHYARTSPAHHRCGDGNWRDGWVYGRSQSQEQPTSTLLPPKCSFKVLVVGGHGRDKLQIERAFVMVYRVDGMLSNGIFRFHFAQVTINYIARLHRG